MRINLFGGPGSGKSTIAAKIFSTLKELHMSVELVNEYVKTMAYQGIVPKDWDQLTIFSNQLSKEEVFLKNGVKHIITDSPILLVACYAKIKFPKLYPLLVDMSAMFNEAYESVDVFIERPDTYQQNGRYEDIDAAKRMDDLIRDVLHDTSTPFTTIGCADFDEIMWLVFDSVKAT